MDRPIIIASLAAARRDPLLGRLTGTNWDLVIFDEAHRLRNPRSASGKLARSLRARYLLVLTATPVENRLSDLYQLVSLVAPGLLGTPDQFRAKHGAGLVDSRPRNLEELRRFPFLLRWQAPGAPDTSTKSCPTTGRSSRRTCADGPMDPAWRPCTRRRNPTSRSDPSANCCGGAWFPVWPARRSALPRRAMAAPRRRRLARFAWPRGGGGRNRTNGLPPSQPDNRPRHRCRLSRAGSRGARRRGRPAEAPPARPGHVVVVMQFRAVRPMTWRPEADKSKWSRSKARWGLGDWPVAYKRRRFLICPTSTRR
ncbi:hypothetical protein H7H78_07565 [Mycobacterium shinjukuense]|nr:hypothetical protein [Mycobacterium shinjukuense]ORB64959.1 hypothetical protein BST45_15740 [Mycobacterium shinjukuense]